MKVIGKFTWLIPDCFLPPIKLEQYAQDYVSHDAICVLNAGDVDANISITLYYSDREPIEDLKAICPARRTNHVRMDQMKDHNGDPLPTGVPYAALVTSDTPIVVQYSRLDTTQNNNALMTTIAWPMP